MGFLDVLEKVAPSVREVRAQIPPYLAWWEAQNQQALAGDGPLWIALGDSTAQGVGASRPDLGYVGLLLQRLRRADPAWRVLNLSISGKQVHDVVHHHLPRMQDLVDEHHLEPRLVTCGLGGNDIVPTPTARLTDDMLRLVDELPAATVLCNLPRGFRPRKARQVNEVVEPRARDRGLTVVDLWAHTGRPWKGKLAADRYHPSDAGYAGLARVMAPALGLGPADQGPPDLGATAG